MASSGLGLRAQRRAAMEEDFDEEALKIFGSLNLMVPKERAKYRDLDAIYQHPTNQAKVFVGNDNAASSKELLMHHGIGAIVNCTDNLKCYHENADGFKYLRFNISYWKVKVKQPPSANDIIGFFDPVWDFAESALESGQSVLIHCLAGAHRAGTTGVAYLMYKNEAYDVISATMAAKLLRPIINPIGGLKELAFAYERALGRKN